MSPLALGEVLKPPLFDLAFQTGGFVMYFILSLVFAIFSAVHLVNLKPVR